MKISVDLVIFNSASCGCTHYWLVAALTSPSGAFASSLTTSFFSASTSSLGSATSSSSSLLLALNVANSA